MLKSGPFYRQCKKVCPYCGSTDIDAEIVGVDYSKGLITAASIGPAGFFNAYANAAILHTCLKCGEEF